MINPDIQISKKEKKKFYIPCALSHVRFKNYNRYTNCKRRWMLFDRFVLINRKKRFELIVYFLILRADELIVFEMDGGEGASLPFKTSIQPLLSLRFKLPPLLVPFRRINHSTTDVLLFTRKPVYVQRYKSHF